MAGKWLKEWNNGWELEAFDSILFDRMVHEPEDKKQHMAELEKQKKIEHVRYRLII